MRRILNPLVAGIVIVLIIVLTEEEWGPTTMLTISLALIALLMVLVMWG